MINKRKLKQFKECDVLIVSHVIGKSVQTGFKKLAWLFLLYLPLAQNLKLKRSHEDQLPVIQDVLAFMESGPEHFPSHDLPYYFTHSNISAELDPNSKYTFFLPKPGAVHHLIPMDAGNPFITNEQLRMKLLKNIIVKGEIKIEEMEDGSHITNLDNKVLTIEAKEGEKYFKDGNKIESVDGVKSDSKAKIYLTKYVLEITPEEVISAIEPGDSPFHRGVHIGRE